MFCGMGIYKVSNQLDICRLRKSYKIIVWDTGKIVGDSDLEVMAREVQVYTVPDIHPGNVDSALDILHRWEDSVLSRVGDWVDSTY
jgi:hypothetical protein